MWTFGKRCLRPLDQIEEVFEGQIGMQAADDVELGDRFGVAGCRCLPGFFERHGVAGGVALLAAEGAELARRHADVGGVDVAIDVEVGHVAVHALAHVVGQPAHGQHVAGTVERKAVVKTEALPGEHLGGDGLKAGVVGVECVAWGTGRPARAHGLNAHTIDDTESRTPSLARWWCFRCAVGSETGYLRDGTRDQGIQRGANRVRRDSAARAPLPDWNLQQNRNVLAHLGDSSWRSFGMKLRPATLPIHALQLIDKHGPLYVPNCDR